MRVFIPAATYLFRPHNTDWRYAAKMLPHLGRHCDELSVISQNSRWADWTTNASYAAHVLDRYLKCVPLKWQYSLAQDCPVAERELAHSRADVILSYERYPACDRGLPVVWMTGPTLAENLTGKYARSEWITRELAWKTARAERATRILFTSTDAMEKFLSACGERFRTKSAMVPFFLPGLSAIEDPDSKWNANELRMLFVGREARRKGLPQLLEVLRESHLPRNMRLTIVSTFADGVVDIPSLPGVGIAVHGESSHAEVLRLMAESHLLAMASVRENYGFVYIEAMSQACVPLAVANPVQREIIGDGGILVPESTPAAIAEGLAPAFEAVWLRSKAEHALRRFQEVHAPQRVASRIRDVVAGAIER